jgi:hypothetical protein
MVKYTCERCELNFNRKSSFDVHINRKNKCDIHVHEKQINNEANNSTNSTQDTVTLQLILEELQIVKTELCNVKKDNKCIKEENKQMKNVKHELKKIQNELQHVKKDHKTLIKQTKTKQMANINNNTSTIIGTVINDTKHVNKGTINNIHVVAFGKENMDFVIDDIGKLCQGNKTVPNLINYVHFNESKP